MRQRQAEETRQRILAVARALLTTQGYVGMTMEAIAEAAEVSPKTIAAGVGSKREILVKERKLVCRLRTIERESIPSPPGS